MPFYAPYAESQSHQRALPPARRGWAVIETARLASSGVWPQIAPICSRVPESGPTCACAALRTSRRCRCLSMHHTLNRNRTNARCTPRAAAGALSRLLASPAAGLGPKPHPGFCRKAEAPTGLLLTVKQYTGIWPRCFLVDHTQNQRDRNFRCGVRSMVGRQHFGYDGGFTSLPRRQLFRGMATRPHLAAGGVL